MFEAEVGLQLSILEFGKNKSLTKILIIFNY